MKYKGTYWMMFAPMMKKSISNRFDVELANQAIRQAKVNIRGCLLVLTALARAIP